MTRVDGPVPAGSARARARRRPGISAHNEQAMDVAVKAARARRAPTPSQARHRAEEA
jgi:hypothetical protein